VRTSSTGRAWRLGFAPARGVEPENHRLDVVFAGGDLYYQKMCVDRLFVFRAAGGTLVLCSHSLYDLRQMCDEALWLRDGRVARAGDAPRVTNAYAAGQRVRMDEDARSAEPMRGAEFELQPRLERVELFDPERGVVTDTVESGRPLEVHIHWKNPGARPVNVGLTLKRQDQTLASGLATHLDGFDMDGAGGLLVLSLPRVELLAGSFVVVVILFDEWGVHRYQELVLARPLVVTHDGKEVGLVRLEHRWSSRPETRLATAAGTDAEKAA
jgi:lipopolysaccharide transport system ATP-binding protein